MSSRESATANWPPNYRAQFWSDRLLAYQVALVLAVLGVFKSLGIFAASLGLLVAALAAGLGLGAAVNFQDGWLVLALVPPLILIAGWGSAIMSFPHRTALYDQYRPGTKALISVSDKTFRLTSNSRIVRSPLVEVTRVRRFGALSAIQLVDRRYIVVPTAALPHGPDPSTPLDLKARWSRP